MKWMLLDRRAVCVYVCVSHFNFSTTWQILTNLSMNSVRIEAAPTSHFSYFVHWVKQKHWQP